MIWLCLQKHPEDPLSGLLKSTKKRNKLQKHRQKNTILYLKILAVCKLFSSFRFWLSLIFHFYDFSYFTFESKKFQYDINWRIIYHPFPLLLQNSLWIVTNFNVWHLFWRNILKIPNYTEWLGLISWINCSLTQKCIWFITNL